MLRRISAVAISLFVPFLLTACGSSDTSPAEDGVGGSASSGAGSGGNPNTNPSDGPAAGNPDGKCDIPAEARAEDVSTPKTVVGTGTGGELHLGRVRERGRQWRGDYVQLRARSGHHYAR